MWRARFWRCTALRPAGAWREKIEGFSRICATFTFFCFEESRQSFSHFSKVCSKLTHRNALPLDEACKVQLVQGLPSTGRKATSIASHLSAASDVDTGRA